MHRKSSVSRTITAETMAGLKRIALIIIAISSSTLMCVLADEDLYSAVLNHLDVRAILQNNDLREKYYNCYMEIGPCTPEQIKMGEVFSDVYQTKCKKCTTKQKENMDMITDWYVTNQPDKWQLIVEKTLNNLKKKNADQ
ncbi:PREDICTED: ejaculatory bulb-specific protein 3-like [Wasmannia auropunctata]|uniref:ejaculatory bulb-specific protein 3-like n=1 Tax=Wasmannia auropunctata TaxID=64793 RepID=UPI0005EE1B33|nr:PREDICTED: ejaculatory bulb-specific protein 3-like [Wasmannia auropunctata]